MKPYYDKINYSNVDDKINAIKYANAFVLFIAIHEKGDLFDLSKILEINDDIISIENTLILKNLIEQNILSDFIDNISNASKGLYDINKSNKKKRCNFLFF